MFNDSLVCVSVKVSRLYKKGGSIFKEAGDNQTLDCISFTGEGGRIKQMRGGIKR